MAQEPLAARSSYYYAHQQKAGAVPKPVHTPLSPEEAQRQSEQEMQRRQSGSSWNTGGTWEEKDITKAFVARIKEVLPGLQSPSGKIVIGAVDKIEGDAHLLHTRGKTRLAWEFEATATWTEHGGEAKGKLELGDLSSDNCDGFDPSVKIEKNLAAGDTRTEVLALKGAILEEIAKIKAEILER
mmetsp:Transcript_17287/g.41183  ORF Transcript_17287/g.41183 Transcript_17287/m.41183 type:complete len:184 (+) Transcript_17287:19-570(+)